jgi:hypothetical protein
MQLLPRAYHRRPPSAPSVGFLWLSQGDWPKIAVAHAHCDTGRVKTYYQLWDHLHHLIDDHDWIRAYFTFEIMEGTLTPQEVKEGLEQIFRSVPDGYFEFDEPDHGDESPNDGSGERRGVQGGAGAAAIDRATSANGTGHKRSE